MESMKLFLLRFYEYESCNESFVPGFGRPTLPLLAVFYFDASRSGNVLAFARSRRTQRDNEHPDKQPNDDLGCNALYFILDRKVCRSLQILKAPCPSWAGVGELYVSQGWVVDGPCPMSPAAVTPELVDGGAKLTDGV